MNAAMHATACQILAVTQRALEKRQRRITNIYTSPTQCQHCGSFTRYTSNRNCVDCHRKRSRARYQQKG